MSNRRMVYQDFFEDDYFGQIDHTGQVLWIGLIVAMADDQGRLIDNTNAINSKVFFCAHIDNDKLHSYLDSFRIANKIVRYNKDGRDLIQIVNWWKYQTPSWASPSNYPPPDGWVDRVKCHIPGNQRKKKKGGNILNINWGEKGGFPDKLHSYLPKAINDVNDDVDVNDKEDIEESGDIAFSPPEEHVLAIYDDNGELASLEDRIIEVFCDRVGLFGNDRPYENDPSTKKWYADWLKDVGKLITLDTTSAEMEEAIALLKINGYSCKRPGALIDTVKNIREDIIKFDTGAKTKIRRYKLKKVYNDAMQRNEYYPEDHWLEKDGAK